MSMAYIRDHYGVPPQRGMKVVEQGRNGRIVGPSGGYLRSKGEGEENSVDCDPTGEMQCQDGEL